MRRAALNPFFWRERTLELEEIVQQKAKKLVSRMQSAFDTTGQIELHCGFRAVSVDVITDYAFDNSYELLSKPDFGKGSVDLLLGSAIIAPFLRQFPFFTELLMLSLFGLLDSNLCIHIHPTFHSFSHHNQGTIPNAMSRCRAEVGIEQGLRRKTSQTLLRFLGLVAAYVLALPECLLL